MSAESDATGGGAGAGLSGFVDGGTPDDDKSVTILGAFGGDEEKNFNASLAAFEQTSGIDIQYVSDQDFTTTIKQKVNSGDSPDIGLFPQPGGLIEFATAGQGAADRHLPRLRDARLHARCPASSTPPCGTGACTAPRCETL